MVLKSTVPAVSADISFTVTRIIKVSPLGGGSQAPLVKPEINLWKNHNFNVC